MNNLIKKLFDSPLDIIGDVHGEIDALKTLMQALGYDDKGNHPEQRKLIFVGDLCDRGIDSIAVIRLVKEMMDLGNAQCVLGNHELNILNSLKRSGNGWFFGSPHQDDNSHISMRTKKATEEDRVFIYEFLSQLPLALESTHLRVVHACWDDHAINELRKLKHSSVKNIDSDYKSEIRKGLISTGITALAEQERKQHNLKDETVVPPMLNNLAIQKMSEQMKNPISIITSGTEAIAEYPFFANGEWRLLNRTPWWDHYNDDIPVVIGHYWRNFNDCKKGLFADIAPNHWFGKKKNVFCIDFSVGKRYLDRVKEADFSSQLATIRLPENILIFENGTYHNLS